MVLVEVLLAVVGLALILKGSEWVTDAVSFVAHQLRTTNVAVGLLLVSLLLSLPEVVVALSAIAKGHAAIGFGVTIGSVIVNLGLVIGLAAMVNCLRVPRHVVTRDGVFMLVATLVVATFALGDFRFDRSDGFVLLLLFIPYVVNVYAQERQLAKAEQNKEAVTLTKSLELTGKMGLGELKIHSGLVILVIGAAMLVAGAEMFTTSLIGFARIFGLPELLVGLTLGALGPSLPNLAAALQAARRGYDELVVSEAIGSNIFTLLVTLGVISIIQPVTVGPVTAMVTTPALVAVTFVFFYFLMHGEFSRASGRLLVGCYFGVLLIELAARVFGG